MFPVSPSPRVTVRPVVTVAVLGSAGRAGEEVADAVRGGAHPVAFGIMPQQDLGHRDADRFGVGEQPVGAAFDGLFA